MLLVKTIIKPSMIPNAGIGLFADQFIEKGTLVWKFDPNFDRIISMDYFQTLDDITKKFIKTYGYKSNIYPFIILCFDNSRFINHSFEPNLSAPSYINDIYSLNNSVASRDINPGEELTENYNDFDDKLLETNSEYY